jgi:hypothetical protein
MRKATNEGQVIELGGASFTARTISKHARDENTGSRPHGLNVLRSYQHRPTEGAKKLRGWVLRLRAISGPDRCTASSQAEQAELHQSYCDVNFKYGSDYSTPPVPRKKLPQQEYCQSWVLTRHKRYSSTEPPASPTISKHVSGQVLWGVKSGQSLFALAVSGNIRPIHRGMGFTIQKLGLAYNQRP